MNTNSMRYLPTYQDAIGPYSLRLPTYRSSYIRRYHPYARYTTPIIQEQFMDDDDFEEPVLDLSILDRRVEPVRVEPTTVEDANQEPNETVEDQPTVEAIDVEAGSQEEQADRNTVFIRVDINPSS